MRHLPNTDGVQKYRAISDVKLSMFCVAEVICAAIRQATCKHAPMGVFIAQSHIAIIFSPAPASANLVPQLCCKNNLKCSHARQRN